jgi:hypothetical protein
MTVKIRMGAAFLLGLAAVAILIVAAPDYFAEVRTAMAAHSTKQPTAPALVVVGSFMGLASWLLVVHQQWRKRQYGWIVASFLLSYLAVIAYSATSLFRPSASHAAA